MALTFELNPKAYVCMLAKVPAESSAYACLKNAKPSSRDGDRTEPAYYYEVHCSMDDAEVLQQTATQHCSEALGAIHRAIRISLGEVR
jgi:hypothetical protein